MTTRRASAAELTGGATFRDLEGIGAGAESRLHRAGVVTWAALAEIVNALDGGRQRAGDRLRDLSDQLAERGEETGADAETEQRQEAFVLRLSLTDSGRPTHGTITNVRSGRERALTGWAADVITQFVEEEAGIADDVSAAPAVAAPPTVPALPSPAPKPEEAASPTETPVADGPWPPPPRSAPCASTEPHHGTVVLDVGRLYGGRQRTIERAVVTHGAVTPFHYRADLLGRAYGSSTAEWATLASLTGRHAEGNSLPLRFTDVRLPQGVQRVHLRLVATDGALPVCRLAEDDEETDITAAG